jgi:hypothetical protein
MPGASHPGAGTDKTKNWIDTPGSDQSSWSSRSSARTSARAAAWPLAAGAAERPRAVDLFSDIQF